MQIFKRRFVEEVAPPASIPLVSSRKDNDSQKIGNSASPLSTAFSIPISEIIEIDEIISRRERLELRDQIEGNGGELKEPDYV